VFTAIAAAAAEKRGPRAGDKLVATADVVMDRGFSVPGSPGTVWPWLVPARQATRGLVPPPSRRTVAAPDPACSAEDRPPLAATPPWRRHPRLWRPPRNPYRRRDRLTQDARLPIAPRPHRNDLGHHAATRRHGHHPPSADPGTAAAAPGPRAPRLLGQHRRRTGRTYSPSPASPPDSANDSLIANDRRGDGPGESPNEISRQRPEYDR